MIPLHLHSYWSLLDGVASVPEIVSFAQSVNLPALALTDSNALYGAMEFVTECRRVGITPILGAELSWVGGHAIVLLAQNMRGYGNLCRLLTRLQSAADCEAALARGIDLTDLASLLRRRRHILCEAISPPGCRVERFAIRSILKLQRTEM